MISADSERTWSADRAPLWDELAALVDRAGRDQRRLAADEVDLLARRYQQAAADLARLRVAQPGSPLLPRLNDLVARAHAVVYRPARTPLRSLGRFLWTGYPRAVWDLRRLIAAAAASRCRRRRRVRVGARRPGHGRELPAAGLRDAGHRAHHAIPAGVMAPTSVAIWSHNIIVSFYDYAGGILFGLGTIYSLYFNSMLLGVLSGVEQPARRERPLLVADRPPRRDRAHRVHDRRGRRPLARGRARPRPAAAAHAGAGRTRRRSVAVVLGTMPLLVVAGTIEGFVTPSAAPSRSSWPWRRSRPCCWARTCCAGARRLQTAGCASRMARVEALPAKVSCDAEPAPDPEDSTPARPHAARTGGAFRAAGL